MNIEITGGSVTVTLGVITAAAKTVHWLVARELERRDKELSVALDARDNTYKNDTAHAQRELDEVRGAFKAVKETQAKLFEKYDAVVRDFNEYKLHVAETYVGEAKLERLIAPIVNRLDSIERDLRRGAVGT